MMLSQEVCFLFDSNIDNRDLQSFPTRRSSDLLPWYLGSAERPTRLFREAFINRGRFAPSGQRSKCQRDRKSTRLNSSHANISYAVFCLKKKNRCPRYH